MAKHFWVASTLGHGNSMCEKCKMTDLEAFAIGSFHGDCLGDAKVQRQRPDLDPIDTPAALGMLNEELAEALVEIGHIWRFGLFPIDSKTGVRYDNMAALERELKDVEYAIAKFRELWARDQIDEAMAFKNAMPRGFKGHDN